MAITLDLLLKVMVQNKASDTHIRSDSPVHLRINGVITPINASTLTGKEVETLIFPLMSQRVKSIFTEKREADFSFDGGEIGRFRFNVFMQKGKLSVAIRHIPLKIPTFEDLRLPVDSLLKLLSNERGIILVTGITGSGKSSTLAAMIEYLNQKTEGHIITVEDPMEFVFTEKKCIISQREIGADTGSFVEALRAALRQDPPHQQLQVRLQLSETLKGVISQRLLPCTGGGRIPAVEVMCATPHIKKMLAENNMDGISAAIPKGAFYGMQSFNQSLVKLHKAGLAKLDDIVQAASNPDDVLLAIKGIEHEMESKGK